MLPTGLTFGSLASGIGWAGQVQSYTKNAGILRCPDDSIPQATSIGVTYYPVSYALNINAAGRSDAVFQAPASTVLAFEVTGDQAAATDGSEGTSGYTVPPATGGPSLSLGWSC